MLDPSAGVAIFTDGSSHYKDKSGGWAFVAFDAFENPEEVGSGASADTTNNRMEMQAWIEGLNYIYEKYGACDVLVYSDSQYIVYGIQDPSRARNHNHDLWFEIESAIEQHKYVEPVWVRGHHESHYNHLVDELAKRARKQGIEERGLGKARN